MACERAALLARPPLSLAPPVAQGELWSASGRIGYEWSWAGYQQGRQPIPAVPVAANVKTQFGARGDGVTDDTAAFTRALESVQRGAILVPAGAAPRGGARARAAGAARDTLSIRRSAVLRVPPFPRCARLSLAAPQGTYVIKGVLNWRKPIVLRGEGRNRTRLLFPKSLTDL